MSIRRLQQGATSLSLIFLLVTAVGCGQQRYRISEERIPLRLGETVVELVMHQAEAPGLTYVHLHDDENTAVAAVLEVLRRRGGRLLELQHTGERNISFQLGDSLYVVDPNRIFTGAGAAATLDTLGAFSDEALQAVRAFADTLLQHFDLAGTEVLVTVHNNTAEQYSVLSYTSEGDLALDARFVHVDEDDDPDDFFFVTTQDLYARLRASGFNVVLQDNATASDDGSLSIYAAAQGLPYVNVEAEHGHFEKQVQMLEILNKVLREQDQPS